ncbi:MAG TPA: chromosomal replication initiator protein DnaA [Waddliaceae bacterium]
MDAWEKFLKAQEQELGAKTVSKWLRSLHILRYDACNLYLEAQDTFQVLWFEEHMRKKAQATLVNNNQKQITIHLSLANQRKSRTLKEEKKTKKQAEASAPFTLKFDELDPVRTFDRFVAAESNLLAYKLLCKMSRCDPLSGKVIDSDMSLTSFNPIYIFGGEGTGKTHLLMAAAHALKNQYQNVIYVRAETFTDHVIKAMRSAEMGVFRQAYRNSDVLLIDDVQLFSKKGATQEELFHTFNTLHLAGKQIILCANCSPAELQYIEPRLVSRFEWGIVLPLEALDYNGLVGTLKNKSEALQFPISNKVADFLLSKFSKNSKVLIRALEALILRLHIQNNPKKTSQTLTESLVKTLLADLLKEEQDRALTPKQIIQRVSEHFEIRPEDLLGEERTRDYVLPRHLAMYLCRKKLNLPYTKIGEVFSRDHSTVMSSIKLIQTGVDNYDQEIARHYHAIIKILD